jgi:ATP-dependent Clp protease ATP-binding subunit ClpA
MVICTIYRLSGHVARAGRQVKFWPVRVDIFADMLSPIHTSTEMFDRYSYRARQALFIARTEAGAVGSPAIDTEHLLLGILCADADLLRRCGTALTKHAIRTRVQQWHIPSAAIETSLDLPVSDDLGRVFTRVASLADEAQCKEIRTEHLLLSLFSEPSCHAAVVLEDSGANGETARRLAEDVDCKNSQSGSDLSAEDITEFLS